jgi:hypothetical protein
MGKVFAAKMHATATENLLTLATVANAKFSSLKLLIYEPVYLP